MNEKEKICDLCLEEAIFHFGITDDAVFHACKNHAKALSDIIYPVGEKLGAYKLSALIKK